MKEQSIFITGNSTGLGLALSQHYLSAGANVYGCSRSGAPIDHAKLKDATIDLADLGSLKTKLTDLLSGVDKLDVLVLNAGILGNIESMPSIDMHDLKTLMDVNVWSNKLLLDHVCESGIKIDHIVGISSGAAVNGNKGWGAYSLSKACLNMLIKLYAAEYDTIHFTALAPGLIDTQMQDYLCDQQNVDEEEYPSVRKLRDSRGTQAMPTPAVAAKHIVDVLPILKNQYGSGAFVDMRNL